MRKEMDDLARRFNVFQNDMRDVKDDVREVKEKVEQVEMTQEEMAYLTKEATERYDLFTGRQTIYVCGGRDGKTRHNSVESFSWPENSWTLEPAMKEARSGPSAFVHGREIYVSGGMDRKTFTDSIDSMNVDEENVKWIKSRVKMPLKSSGHTMISHENSAILTGGRGDNNTSDVIYEISLSPPHNTKLLTKMPEPKCYHSCQINDNQMVVAGGMTSKYFKDTKNTVYVYDMNNNECKTLPPLPFAIADMASVSYKGNVILIGGSNKKGQSLNSVVMYDVKTGKIKMLPCLNHKRAGSVAVITGNVIIVLGGYDYQTKTYLNTVECLDLNSGNVWRGLSPMTTKRNNATAVLKPIS
jgi:N-acetylneuraminic acid mutarotase